MVDIVGEEDFVFHSCPMCRLLSLYCLRQLPDLVVRLLPVLHLKKNLSKSFFSWIISGLISTKSPKICLEALD